MNCCCSRVSLISFLEVNATAETKSVEELAVDLQQCGRSRDLQKAVELHAEVSSSIHRSNRRLQNFLLQMYGRCGSLHHAESVFETIHPKNVYSWTFMITASATNGDYAQAIKLFRLTCLEGELPDDYTLSCVFSACSFHGDLAYGQSLHASLQREQLSSVVGNSLLTMYGRCGELSSAELVFDQIVFRDVSSWNALVAANAINRDVERALSLFHMMDLEGVSPDNFTFGSVIGLCSLEKGQELHKRIIDTGLGSVVSLGNALIHMYSMREQLQLAEEVFNGMQQRDRITWNALISCYSQNDCLDESVKCFQEMNLEGIKGDVVTSITMLDVFGCIQSVGPGDRFCQSVFDAGECLLEQDIDGVLIGMVNMYGKHGELELAEQIFDWILKKDVLSWNSLIAACSRLNCWTHCILLYKRLLLEGVRPNEATFVSVLDSCAGSQDFYSGSQIRDHVKSSGYDSRLIVRNTLIHMYGSCGQVDEAKKLFDTSEVKDLVTWSTMIDSHAKHHPEESIQFFRCMEIEGLRPNLTTFIGVLEACSSLPEQARVFHKRIVDSGFQSSTITGNALLKMYSTLGRLQEARDVFEAIDRKDVLSWTSIIAANARQVNGTRDALFLSRRMDNEGVKMNHYSAAAVISACTHPAEGGQIHIRVEECGLESDPIVGAALVFMYCRMGKIEQARKVFRSLSERDVITWTMMIAVYAQNGCLTQASQVYHDMNLHGVEPNNISFITILFACSHSGVASTGKNYLISMGEDYSLEVGSEHYGCLVDLFCRSGRVSEAEELVNSMPVEPSAAAVGALSSCNSHHHHEQKIKTSQHLDDPGNATSYINQLISKLS